MQHYHIWFNLRPGTNDLQFSTDVDAFLQHMKDAGTIVSWRLERRTLGLCSAPLGEWHVDIATQDMGQLQAAFDTITPRSGPEEKLHAAVWSKTVDLQFALYRDFPDANRHT